MTQAYSDPSRADDAYALPDVEVFEITWDGEMLLEDGSTAPLGWYWWTCMPGCLPDGEADGPYETQAAALEAAQDGSDYSFDPE
jgi:hypothetical protein